MSDATVVLVPGLRGHVEDHWQTRLAASLPGARTVPPLGRTDAGLQARVTLLDQIVEDVAGPVVLVAHSAGVLGPSTGRRSTAPRGWSARSW
jgi:predicted alpha/beta hydrolase family esterase